MLPTFYDDGGFSGGNMERPPSSNLLTTLIKKKINVVVVYKVDRLTRSLADFAKIVEQFDAKGVSFCFGNSAIQYHQLHGAINTERPFIICQFEREVTGERIRDKIARL